MNDNMNKSVRILGQTRLLLVIVHKKMFESRRYQKNFGEIRHRTFGTFLLVILGKISYVHTRLLT